MNNATEHLAPVGSRSGRLAIYARRAGLLGFALLLLSATHAWPQAPEGAEKLTLKRAVALAVQNSREVQLARMQYDLSQKAAGLQRAEFRPNLYSGSGLAYTNGFPQTPSGGPPSVFNLSYIQTLFNGPLRGELRAAEARTEIQRLGIESVRDGVIVRTALAYLELAKVRHSLELLRHERESAQKIVDVTRERQGAGLELPVEVTKVQLSSARIEQRIAHLEGREDTLEADLRTNLGLPADQRVEVAYEDLPATADQPLRELLNQALSNNVGIKQAEAEQRARLQRLKGEKLGYFPAIDIIGQYGLFARFNNFDEFFRRFRRHNLTVGLEFKIPIYSARTSAAVAQARTDLNAVEIEAKHKSNQLEVEVRRQAHLTRELDLAREVARLELELAQENLRVLQAQFQEGRAGLRNLEKARLEENDKWLDFLDADYQRQQARLELLRSTGQLARIFQ